MVSLMAPSNRAWLRNDRCPANAINMRSPDKATTIITSMRVNPAFGIVCDCFIAFILARNAKSVKPLVLWLAEVIAGLPSLLHAIDVGRIDDRTALIGELLGGLLKG